MKKLFLLLIFATLTARAATYQVALPGGGTLVINGLPYLNPQITNSASVVWTTNADGLLTLAATAVGTNASIVFVEGSAVSAPNFGVSTEIDPAVVTTNVTFSIVNSSITTNKIDPAFYALLMQTGGTGSVYADGVAISNILSSVSITNTVAAGASTLSIRDSGVSAGTYSNLVAAIGADGRVTSASSATNLVLSTLSAGTVTATSVAGNGSSLTNLNASNISSGTLAAARLPTSGVSAGNYTNPTVTIDTYGRITVATNGTASSGGGLTLVDDVPITNVNFRSSWANKASVSSVTNVDWVPQPPTTASSASLTPAFNSSRGHEFTLTNNATLNAPSGVTSAMVGDTFRLVFIQDSTGNRTLTTATNYLFGTDITGLTLTTNAGARDYMVLYVRRTDVFDVVGFVRGYAQ